MPFAIDMVSADNLEELAAFAKPFQQEALDRYPGLVHPGEDALHTVFQKRLESGTGVVARRDGAMVGCLLGIGPIDDFRPGHRGVYAPLCSCLISGPDEDRVFTNMLTEYGNLDDFASVQIAAITVFPYNQQLNASLVQNGFGVRCADAVVRISDLPTEVPDTNLTIEEVSIAEAVSLREVKQVLAIHLASSPVYQERFDFSAEFIAWKSEQRQSVHIAARDGDRVVGFIEATFDGENYLTRNPQMRNICGAGVMPAYRGKGIMRALLVALANHYRPEGITVLGVDYETQNPAARGFWEQYFTPYTWSWERHFDRPWGTL